MQVFVGEYLIYVLDAKLVYPVMATQNPSNISTIVPAILIPVVVILVALAAFIVGIFYFNVKRAKRSLNFELIDNGGER